jgi:hypothetical protein
MEDMMENGNPETRVRENIRYYGTMGPEAISTRIARLEEEKDIDRIFATVASGLGLFGLVAGFLGGRTLRMFTWIALPMLFARSLGRWVPPVEGLRRMGFRSRREIEEEKYALKALRGDFKGVEEEPAPEAEMLSTRASRALEAVKA